MSSISSTSPSTGLIVPQNDMRAAAAAVGADAATPTEEVVSYKPQWLVPTPGSARSFEMLGLSSPSSSADVATLIAQVSLDLELTVDDGRKKDALAKLSALAAALTSFDTAALEATMNTKIDSEARVQTTKDQLDSKSSSLLQERNAATTPASGAAVDYKIQQARIDSLDQRISDLTADLAAAGAGSDAATAIKADIAALTSQKGAISSAVSQAQANISNASSQVQSWQKKIDDEKAKKQPDQKLIDSYTSQRNQSQASLDSAYASLKSGAANGLAADRASLGTVLTAKTGETATATGALQALIAAATAFARAAAAQYGAEKSGDDIAKAGRDTGIDIEFDDISAELKAAASRLDAIQGNLAAELEANASHADERAGNVALSVVAALASVVSALSSAAEVSTRPDTGAGPKKRVLIDA